MTKYTTEIRDKEYIVCSEILEILTSKEQDELGIKAGNIPINNIPEFERAKKRYELQYVNRHGRANKVKDHEGKQLYRRMI